MANNTWDIDITNIYRNGDDGVKLGELTVLAMPNFGSRKMFMQYTGGRLKPMYYKKVEKKTQKLTEWGRGDLRR